MADNLNFTKTALDALPEPAPGTRSEYRDTKQPGLRLRVSATGVKTFCVLKRLKAGGMERISLARYPAMTIEQARKKAAEILGKIAEGDNPAETRRSIRGEMTMRQLFEEYGRLHGSRKISWTTDQQRYRDYLDPTLGGQKLSAITTGMISRILAEMAKRGKSNATINNVRALASGIFNKGIEWNRVSTNPVSPTRTLKAVRRDRFIQSSELPRFFVALLDEPNPTIRDYFLISLLTGARRSNVLAMRWSEVNFDTGVWRISRTKNGEPQNVTLSAEALQILKQRKEAAAQRDEFVFPGDGETKHLVEPKKGWKRIFDRDELSQLTTMIDASGGRLEPLRDERTGKPKYESMEEQLVRARALAVELNLPVEGTRLVDLRIHDLRRTFGSWQAITGASLLVIGKSLNHKSPMATTIYARLDLDPVRAAIDKATSAMLGAAGVTQFSVGGIKEKQDTPPDFE